MDYKIQEVYGSFYVQYFRRGKGWRLYMGKEHIRFDRYNDAYAWLVEHKFNGNEEKARQHIYHAV